MTRANLHPPANRRCQVYVAEAPDKRNLLRCVNDGTHWEKWPGCNCPEPDEDMCSEDLITWECDGEHRIETEASA